ncbi:MAG: oligosaccharide flippase family protein, partial [Endomicrobiia bacterium]|nr:oligosaccharide flippase family protein [Endomicrobiia bacterium]
MTSFFHKIQKNVRFNFYHYAFSLGLGFFLTPLIVRKLGPEEYGLWVMAGIVIGYFGFLDFGLNRAAVRHVSMCAASGDEEKLRDVLGSAFVMNILFGLVAFAAVFVLNEFLAVRIFKVTPGVLPYARTALYLMSFVFLFRFPSAAMDSALIGIQRIDVIQMINIGGMLARAAAILGMLAAGGGIVAMVGVSLGVVAAHCVVVFFAIYRLIPAFKGLRLKINVKVLRDMFVDGFYQTMIGAATQLGFYMDKILISYLLSVSEVTPYHLGNMAAILPFTVSHNFFTPVYAASAELKARNDAAGLKKL